MSDVKSRVMSIIVDKLGVAEDEVTTEASFTNDLGADSLDTVELIMEFEKEFNIAIPDDQAEKIQTVGDAITTLTSCDFAVSFSACSSLAFLNKSVILVSTGDLNPIFPLCIFARLCYLW